MNRFKTLEDRREATSQLIANEHYQLKEKGYNPITRKFVPVKAHGIEPTMHFLQLLVFRSSAHRSWC
jgi:hypothetical protein